MNSHSPSVTVGYLPRERYSIAGESLETLIANTAEPYELIVVAPAVPDRYRAEMDEVLKLRPNTTVLEVDRPLLPAESKNLILEHASGDYVAFVENDVLYPSGWLQRLLRACEEFPADVVSPLINEGRFDKGHFDHHLGRIIAREGQPIEVGSVRNERSGIKSRTQVDFVEQHCLLYRRDALAAITPFDNELNTRDEVDVSMALWSAGKVVVVEPSVVINYIPPTTSPEPDELEYFSQRWDLDQAEKSREVIRRRWNLKETPGDLGFVRARNHLVHLPRIHRELDELVSRGGKTILLENGEWFGTDITEGLNLVPYTNWNGLFGGFPANEGAALDELDREIGRGATQLAIGWPADWWLPSLPALQDRLDRSARLLSDDGRLRVYSLVEP